MDTRLDEQFVYERESLPVFEKNGKSFSFVDGSTLPELKLKDGDSLFPEDLPSVSSPGSISRMLFSRDSLPVSLPNIESSFAPTSGQDKQEFSTRFHPYRGPHENESQGENLSDFREVCQNLYQPTTISNFGNYDQYAQSTKVSQYNIHQLQPATEKNHPVFDLAQQQWMEVPRSQYGMNSNNNNINRHALSNGNQTNYYFNKPQNERETLETMRKNAIAVSACSPYQSNPNPNSVSNPAFSRPGNQETRTNFDVKTSNEILGVKFSPDRKNRKRRKKRSPNEPQKPVSAYALFFRDTQASIKVDNPSATFGEISKIVASMWDSLSDNSKQVYKQKTETAKRDYLKQLAAYRANLVSKGGLDTECEKDRNSKFQMFKNEQRSSSTAFHPSSKLHIMSNKIVQDIHRPQLAYDMNNPQGQHQLVNVNILCEREPVPLNHAEISQHPKPTSHFMVQPGADVSSTQN